MEMETKMQFLQDEIQIMRQQLGNERIQREYNGDNKHRLLKDASSYERTVQTLQERHMHDVRYYESKQLVKYLIMMEINWNQCKKRRKTCLSYLIKRFKIKNGKSIN